MKGNGKNPEYRNFSLILCSTHTTAIGKVDGRDATRDSTPRTDDRSKAESGMRGDCSKAESARPLQQRQQVLLLSSPSSFVDWCMQRRPALVAHGIFLQQSMLVCVRCAPQPKFSAINYAWGRADMADVPELREAL